MLFITILVIRLIFVKCLQVMFGRLLVVSLLAKKPMVICQFLLGRLMPSTIPMVVW
ncbi:hypothetical protein [Marine gokushovirus]|nr:hypothetical protein [Marine gokushovirus]